ncbi:hypothetical protein EOL96_01300, partial [Candidatus Saccharibacteria bacterium]|nr:hypothetical protein [Candidatus Saccharibacteria bacterium]
MKKAKQPARLNRYANLARPKATARKRRVAKKGFFVWFWKLSRKKKTMVIIAPILAFLILTPIITYFVYAKDISDQERLMNRNNTGIVLKDKDGGTFYSIGRAEHRTMISLEDMSPYVVDALIATEDKDFYNHGGFSLFSIFRAMFT